MLFLFLRLNLDEWINEPDVSEDEVSSLDLSDTDEVFLFNNFIIILGQYFILRS